MAHKFNKDEVAKAKKLLTQYYKEKAKNKSKEYYGKAKSKTKKSVKTFGQFVKKILTTK